MTGIEWSDYSANHWVGCSEIPAATEAKSGCSICYAKAFAARRLKVGWGAKQPRRPVSGFRGRMERLNRLAQKTGLPFAVFSMSLGDWLDAEVDQTLRLDFIEVVESTPNLTWLLLTHRPHLISKLAPASWRATLPSNIWPGVTVDHRLHTRRWDELASWWGDTGRAWVSAEPLASSLSGISFAGAAAIILGGASNTNDPDWALDPAWVQEMIEEHASRLFFKQWGVWREGQHMSKKLAGREIDGAKFDRTPWPRHREILREAAKQPAATVA
nr:DUF5131 family protein [Desulfovibrio sp.]